MPRRYSPKYSHQQIFKRFSNAHVDWLVDVLRADVEAERVSLELLIFQ
jgi:hypothetical protein